MMFAAGFGTRMKHLTRTRPKPLIPVLGKPLIDHTLDLIREAGIGTVVANLHYLPDQLERYLAPLGVRTVTEAPDILETGGGLRNALPLLGAGPVFTTNTDAIWVGPNPFRMLAEAWDPHRMDALLLGVPPSAAVGHEGKGDFLHGTEGRLTRGPGVIYGGAQIIRTDLLTGIEDRKFSLNLLWDRMADAGRLHGLTYPGRWCDVGHPGGIAEAEALLKSTHV